MEVPCYSAHHAGMADECERAVVDAVEQVGSAAGAETVCVNVVRHREEAAAAAHTAEADNIPAEDNGVPGILDVPLHAASASAFATAAARSPCTSASPCCTVSPRGLLLATFHLRPTRTECARCEQ
jgi:hypothetical protein